MVVVPTQPPLVCTRVHMRVMTPVVARWIENVLPEAEVARTQ